MSFSTRLAATLSVLILLAASTGVLLLHLATDAIGWLPPRDPVVGTLLPLSVALLAALVGISLTRLQVRPVQDLTALLAGELAEKRAEPIRRRVDEIGTLARGIEALRHALEVRNERMDQQRKLDPVTGLPNRTIVRDRLEMAMARAQRQQSCLGVLHVNVIKLGAINDRYGHHAGDMALKLVAERLMRGVRGSDTVCRIGSSEFLVILEDGRDEDLLRVAAALSERLGQDISVRGKQVRLRAASGIALFPLHGRGWEMLLRRADVARQHARERDEALFVYTEGLDEEHLRELTLQDDFQEAIPRRELAVLYQPKMVLAQRRVNQVEALVRWQHGKLGLIRPDEFIPIAERSGQVRLLTHWVLEQVMRQQQEWQSQNMEILVAVNLSALDLRENQIVHVLKTLTRMYGVPPSALILEVTESAILGDMSMAVSIIDALQREGFLIAIDDFGTGYSSLAQLKTLPVRELKIDKSFVQHMHENNDDAVIVQSTIQMAHLMGIKVVAEGVETEETLNLLEQWGCDIIQGYYLGRPMPAADFTGWVRRCELRERSGKPADPGHPTPVAAPLPGLVNRVISANLAAPGLGSAGE